MPDPRPLRADARRNLEKLKVAALEVFQERGLETPLEEVARRADVSIGTLYNRFRSRQELIDAVLPDLALRSLDRVMRRAGAQATPWKRFVAYVEGMCALQAADAALNDIIAQAYQNAAELSAACQKSLTFGSRLIAEAQADGSLRTDLTPDDIFVIFWLNAHLTRTVGTAAPDAWRRQIAFTLDGFRAGNATPLPVGPGIVKAAVPVMLAGDTGSTSNPEPSTRQ
ncbi:TetR family transcriptional regulator [Microtetraspora sp. NBRC 13810]|uniref:TetR/AcrR family transcriptional regulator n=1 Tax=Microtetraspora sp. NBRC 13810 TaxID=3030990 RepID=UPI0024A47936|nr:TetR/AcrR family transcriptional regulator [Microtetraspora sp. NBRC 13810]GLW13064.1 TetR family transcriptional regulator [Microtetraspora sp. NBRC 13810]